MASLFFQTGSTRKRNQAKKAFALIKSRAISLKSTALAALAVHMQKDHFKKVRQLIKDLIAKLEEQAEAEQTKKTQCDEDIKAQTKERDEQQVKIEDEQSAIATNKAKIEQETANIQRLSEEIAATQQAMQEAAELRAEEKADNEQTLADSEAGKASIENAIAVLTEFYEGAAFVQTGSRLKKPSTTVDRDGNRVADVAPSSLKDEEYKGNQEASKGVIGMLETIKSDYENTIEDTTADEKTAASEHETERESMQKMVDDKEEQKTKAQAEKDSQENDLAANQDDLKDAQDALETALKLLQISKADCIDDSMSHEDKRARRDQEIASLKEAANILEDMSFLQRRD